jgi:hypothetical protein
MNLILLQAYLHIIMKHVTDELEDDIDGDE